VNVSAAGGLNGTLGYLQARQEIGARFDLALGASRPAMLDAVKLVRPDLGIVRFVLWKLVRLGLSAFNLIETGSPGSGELTRVFIASAVRT
jgi:hypothetical protein